MKYVNILCKDSTMYTNQSANSFSAFPDDPGPQPGPDIPLPKPKPEMPPVEPAPVPPTTDPIPTPPPVRAFDPPV